MIIETRQQAKVTRHEPGVMFHCCECGEVKPVQTEGGTGYGYDEREMPICYECCGKIDRASMEETGRATLYLTHNTDWIGNFTDGTVSNWPGTLKLRARIKRGYHNFGLNRYDVWFVMDKCVWHGVTIGDNTQICHCKRTKERTD